MLYIKKNVTYSVLSPYDLMQKIKTKILKTFLPLIRDLAREKCHPCVFLANFRSSHHFCFEMCWFQMIVSSPNSQYNLVNLLDIKLITEKIKERKEDMFYLEGS